jgi:hypothetical protein
MEGHIETISKGSERIFVYTEEKLIGKKRVSIFSLAVFACVIVFRRYA